MCIRDRIIGVPILSGILFVYSWRYPFLLYLIAVPVAIWAWYVIPQSAQSASSSMKDYINELVLFVSKPRMACLVTTFVIRFLLLFGDELSIPPIFYNDEYPSDDFYSESNKIN